ncbi:MAG: energy-coupling factor transporter ATPase [Oscillospiraceae bacterium]|nr:energy-coupling factor transporter ATPase [Oscillospiraceae bacterium]
MSEIIRFENVSFAYDDNAPEALRGVSLGIERGSFTAVLGHNGSGKSTLAKHMNAILLPTCGRVLVNGTDTADESALLKIRSTVGMVFQNPDNQIVASIVEDDVAFAPENLGVPSAEIRRRVDAALECVGMYDYRLHAPHLLSGGQKQRVAIAGVIAMQPECIVLDEPTAMLDPAGRREVLGAVEAMRRERGMTVVLITHHMDECVGADRLLVMSGGEVAMDGTPREVFSRPAELRALGLTVPDTRLLLDGLAAEGWDLPADALTVSECARVIADFMLKEKHEKCLHRP